MTKLKSKPCLGGCGKLIKPYSGGTCLSPDCFKKSATTPTRAKMTVKQRSFSKVLSK